MSACEKKLRPLSFSLSSTNPSTHSQELWPSSTGPPGLGACATAAAAPAQDTVISFQGILLLLSIAFWYLWRLVPGNTPKNSRRHRISICMFPQLEVVNNCLSGVLPATASTASAATSTAASGKSRIFGPSRVAGKAVKTVLNGLAVFCSWGTFRAYACTVRILAVAAAVLLRICMSHLGAFHRGTPIY